MRWDSYFAVCAAVISVGLALGVSLPLVSLRLESSGHGAFAIGIMAAMPAVGVLLGARLAAPLARQLGTPRTLSLCLLSSGLSVALLAIWPSYGLWLLLRLLIGVALTLVFVLGESWINQLVPDRLRGRLVALYGTGFAVSQLCGPLLLVLLGTADNRGFWFAAALLASASLLLLGRGGAPGIAAGSLSGGFVDFCRQRPAIAWAVVLFAAFEAMVLTLFPLYMLREGFDQDRALWMASVVVVGEALLQLPIGWLADRMPRPRLFRLCGVGLLLSSLGLPWLLHGVWIWPLLVLFGASAGGLYTLSLILIGERFRDAALVRANAHIAVLWGVGCLLGPLATGAGSQWLSGHALAWIMAAGAALFVWLAWRRGAFDETPAGLVLSD
ncbi:MAG: MFS transporter [Pseudomonas sp.]|uniref:MFS transporter n=1 Tax=Pseudomonas sp. TaxID=306 RepID=UPI003398B968